MTRDEVKKKVEKIVRAGRIAEAHRPTSADTGERVVMLQGLATIGEKLTEMAHGIVELGQQDPEIVTEMYEQIGRYMVFVSKILRDSRMDGELGEVVDVESVNMTATIKSNVGTLIDGPVDAIMYGLIKHNGDVESGGAGDPRACMQAAVAILLMLDTKGALEEVLHMLKEQRGRAAAIPLQDKKVRSRKED